MMKALGDELSCPICLEQLTPHAVQCKNGHNTCSRCKNKGCNKCPLCREPFVETPNRVLDKMLTVFSSVPCPNAGMSDTASVSDTHQAQSFTSRRVMCPLYEVCGWFGTATSWLSHVQEEHYDRGSLLPNTLMKLDGGSFNRLFNKGCAIKVGNNNYFFYTSFHRQHLTVQYVPIEEQADNVHSFTMMLINNNDEAVYSLKLRLPKDLSTKDGDVIEKTFTLFGNIISYDNIEKISIVAN